MNYNVGTDYSVVNANIAYDRSVSDTTDRAYHHGHLRPALIAAAERTVREQGVDQLSLRELAREVGVSHAAPRRHFPDRQALLDAVAIAGFARLDAQLRAALDSAGDEFGPRLTATVTSYIRFATDDAALLELMFTSKHRPGADHVLDAATPAFGLMSELIVQGQQAGQLAAGDPEKVGILLFATMQGIAALVNGGMVSTGLLDGLVDEAVANFLRGARPA